MDYVPAHGNTMKLEDRDDTSGARVFDGEDQGKLSFSWTSICVHSRKIAGLLTFIV